MNLTEQLCPKDEIKIEVDLNLKNWLIDAQMNESIATPLPNSPRNSSFQGYFIKKTSQFLNFKKLAFGIFQN